MEKPASLRSTITASQPWIKANPDKLALFISHGSVKATKHTLGHDLAYTLNIALWDFTGDIDILNTTIVNWLQTNQPDILGPGQVPENRWTFDIDIIDHNSCDILITLRLTERIIAVLDDADKIHISHGSTVLMKDR